MIDVLYTDYREIYERTKMVTVQDISLQLTKPVKELAKWNFPFSQVCLMSSIIFKYFFDSGNVLCVKITSHIIADFGKILFIIQYNVQ